MTSEVDLVLLVVAAEDVPKRGAGRAGRPGQRKVDGYCYRCRVEYRVPDGHEHTRGPIPPRKTGSRR